MLWLIEYENLYWCGGKLSCVAEADSAQEAEDKAQDHMEQCQYDLYWDEVEEAVEEGEMQEDEPLSSVIFVVEFNENNEEWKWFKDPVQSQLYPLVT